MKLLFLSSFAHLALEENASFVSGGAELQIALLAKELVKLGHEVTIVGTDDGKADRRVLAGVMVRNGGPYHTGALGDTMKALPRVWRAIADARPDFIVLMGAGTWVFFLLPIARWFGSKLVFVSGSDIDVDGSYRRMEPLKGALYEFALRRADARFAMTEHQERGFRAHGHSCFIYRNLLPPLTRERDFTKKTDFLWVSSAQQLKQPGLYLDLAESMPDCSFAMICPLKQDRVLWERTKERAQSLANVQFEDWVAYDRIQAWFDRAKVFVNTSDYEGFPNTFVQSGLGHTALLTLSVDPDGYIARNRVGLCARGDCRRMREYAQELMTNGTLLAEMQANSARFVAENHDTQKNVAAFLAGVENVRGTAIQTKNLRATSAH